MNRADFEALRDLPGKTIRGDVRFVRRQATAPAVVAEDLAIENTLGVELRLTISYNTESGAKSFNVHVPGVGPVCRLDVDGPPTHPQAAATSTPSAPSVARTVTFLATSPTCRSSAVGPSATSSTSSAGSPS